MISQQDHIRNTKEAAEIYTDGTYLESNKTWHVEDSPWKANQIRKILVTNNIQPSTICEVGCGAGEILQQLSCSMPEASFVGYEVSPQAFELCKRRESEKVKYFLRNIFDDDAYYECLLCIDVFEHVEDYIGFIKSLKSKSDYKVFHIPLDVSAMSVLRNSILYHREISGHLHYFTPETAVATLQHCGYEIIDKFYTTGFDIWPATTLKIKMGKLVRKALFNMSPDFMVRSVNGCSLLVLAK